MARILLKKISLLIVLLFFSHSQSEFALGGAVQALPQNSTSFWVSYNGTSNPCIWLNFDSIVLEADGAAIVLNSSTISSFNVSGYCSRFISFEDPLGNVSVTRVTNIMPSFMLSDSTTINISMTLAQLSSYGSNINAPVFQSGSNSTYVIQLVATYATPANQSGLLNLTGGALDMKELLVEPGASYSCSSPITYISSAPSISLTFSGVQLQSFIPDGQTFFSPADPNQICPQTIEKGTKKEGLIIGTSITAASLIFIILYALSVYTSHRELFEVASYSQPTSSASRSSIKSGPYQALSNDDENNRNQGGLNRNKSNSNKNKNNNGSSKAPSRGVGIEEGASSILVVHSSDEESDVEEEHWSSDEEGNLGDVEV